MAVPENRLRKAGERFSALHAKVFLYLCLLFFYSAVANGTLPLAKGALKAGLHGFHQTYKPAFNLSVVL